MQNRKATLIETLRGSTARLNEIPAMLHGISIFDENGYVDTEFFKDCLACVNEFMAASNSLVGTLTALLGPCGCTATGQPARRDEGREWSVEEILKHCTLQDNVLKLPDVQLNKKSYAEAKKWIEEAGGRWTGGKVQGFTFPFRADRVFAILHEGRRCNLQQEFQFFATPPELARWLVSLVGVSRNDKILEPSAGTGAIVDAILHTCPECGVDCFELMPENQELLLRKEGVNLIGEDFLQSQVGGYTRIIANPPFSDNQDVNHVMEMYRRLAPGGRLAAIMSRHWTFAQESVCADFRQFLQDHQAQVIDIPEGAFKSSGTGISTVAVVIDKY